MSILPFSVNLMYRFGRVIDKTRVSAEENFFIIKFQTVHSSLTQDTFQWSFKLKRKPAILEDVWRKMLSFWPIETH